MQIGFTGSRVLTCSTPYGNQRFVHKLFTKSSALHSRAQRLTAIRGLYTHTSSCAKIAFWLCSTPYGNQRFVHIPIHPDICNYFPCSTPYGNQRFVHIAHLKSCTEERPCAQRLTAIRGLYTALAETLIREATITDITST